MTQRRSFKRLVRSRMRETGETYTAALLTLQGPDTPAVPHREGEPTVPTTDRRDEVATSETVGTSFPILPAHDVALTVALFEQLGFASDVYASEGYAILRRSGIELHFTATEHVDPLHNNGMAFVRLTDAMALYEEFEATGALPVMAPGSIGPDELQRMWDAGDPIARMAAIEDKPWGIREFAILDPSNNLIRFGQPLG
jgi:hypothetical protein